MEHKLKLVKDLIAHIRSTTKLTSSSKHLNDLICIYSITNSEGVVSSTYQSILDAKSKDDQIDLLEETLTKKTRDYEKHVN
jgi:hypothetical protein